MPEQKRILIVEDESDMAFAVRLQLEAAGFSVDVAVDGKEGLEKARRLKPDLIILDNMLPKMDGYRVCRMLKFDERYKHIPIIMLTARAQKNDEAVGFEVGVNAYITKPFDPKALLSKIKNLIAPVSP